LDEKPTSPNLSGSLTPLPAAFETKPATGTVQTHKTEYEECIKNPTEERDDVIRAGLARKPALIASQRHAFSKNKSRIR
jgi:hypothetical protein